ncbi:MAG: ribonuclease P protein component [Porticoccaceae bacterium]|nr:ribonuclease P protein component [Porticoccaceae bacterium]
MPRATFGKDRRLLKASEYKEVFDNNSVRVAHPKYLILAKPNGTSVSRLGLVVGKKNVPTAVGRNQVKRIVRETFRNSLLPVALDIIFLARKDADKLPSFEMTSLLQQSWVRLSARLNADSNKGSSNNGGLKTNA